MKWRALLVWLALSLLLSCDKKADEVADSAPSAVITETSEPVPESASAAEGWVDVKLLANAPAGSGWDAMYQRFQRNLQGDPTRRMRVQMDTAMDAATPDAKLSSVMRGAHHVGGFPLAGAAVLLPDLEILLAPYLFDSEEQADFVLDQHVQTLLAGYLEKNGLVLLALTEAGPNGFYSSKPIRAASDFADLSLRASPTLTSRLTIAALGAKPVALAFGEHLAALDSGQVSGGESIAYIYLTSGTAAKARFWLDSAHNYDSGIVVANKAWLDSLAADQQAALRAAMPSAPAWRAAVRQVAGERFKQALKSGEIDVAQLAGEQRKQLVKRLLPVREQLMRQLGPDAGDFLRGVEQGKLDFENQPRIDLPGNPSE
jgi:TRAP-type transport system periplasmic protein